MTKLQIELSVVLPCLNEEKTVGICVEKAQKVFQEQKINGEVIVVDNGSTDKSAEMAKKAGARVVHESKKGYGRAYLKGFSEAKGNFIVMADSDNTYDLLEIPKLLEPLKKNESELILGSRFKGNILPGAMPWLNKYLGNPVLTGILNLFFHSKISDAHSGFRAFKKELLKKINLMCSGMEFASEMLIKSLKNKIKIIEIPISYYKREGKTKLNSFSDGWRHLRFMFLFAPNYTFFVPGFILLIFGIGLNLLLLKGPFVFGSITLDIHPAVFGSMIAIIGYQLLLEGIYAKKLASKYGFEKEKGVMKWLSNNINLEKGVMLGLLSFLVGLLIDINIIYKWVHGGLSGLGEMRTALFALTLVIIGLQTIFSSWFLSLLDIEKIY